MSTLQFKKPSDVSVQGLDDLFDFSFLLLISSLFIHLSLVPLNPLLPLFILPQ